MMRCKEIARLLASDEWREASLIRRIQIRLHLWMCRDCRRYGDQLAGMGRAARELLADPAKDQAAIDRLRSSLLADDDKS